MLNSPDFQTLWPTVSGLGMLEAMATGRITEPDHTFQVGLRLLSAERGITRFAWQPPATLSNPAGLVHGGYSALVLDDAANLACVTVADRFRPLLTTSLSVTYFRPTAPDSSYEVTGIVVHSGSTRCIADSHIEDSRGRLIARASGDFTLTTVFDPPTPTSAETADVSASPGR